MLYYLLDTGIFVVHDFENAEVAAFWVTGVREGDVCLGYSRKERDDKSG